jgi:hypothetical protein
MSWSGTTPQNAVFAYSMTQIAAKAINMNGGDQFRVALFNNGGTPDRTVTTATLCSYGGSGSQWVTGNEVTSSGYTAGGGTAGNVTGAISQSSNVVYFTSTSSPSWSGVTFSGSNEPYGILLYDTTVSGNILGICFNYFGAQTVTAGTFTITFATSPVTGAIASFTC